MRLGIGDMSLIGPRPLLMRYLDRYTSTQMRRHEVRPGITGWAQVNGRNGLTWEQKFALDIWYVDHLSLWLDLKIIPMTIWKILKRDGISQEGFLSSPEFVGSSQQQSTLEQYRAKGSKSAIEPVCAGPKRF